MGQYQKRLYTELESTYPNFVSDFNKEYSKEKIALQLVELRLGTGFSQRKYAKANELMQNKVSNLENYDEIFSRINEAYGIALGFEQSNFNEYEGDSIEDIFDNFFNSGNNSSDKSFFGKTQDFSNVFDENEITNKSISEWLGRLKNLLLSEKRPLTEYREILRDFHFNFDVSEKNQIREILQKNGELAELSSLSPIVQSLAGSRHGDNRFYFPKEMLDQNSIFASITQQFLHLIENDHFTPNKNE